MPTKKTNLRQARQRRVRAKVTGTASRPRLNVYRSLRYIYAQLIDDQQGVTLASATDFHSKLKGNKVERAKQVGELIAKAAAEKKITEVVFDRGGNLYHGRVAALAEGARSGGLKI